MADQHRRHGWRMIAKDDGNPTMMFKSGFTGEMVLWRTVQGRGR